MSGGCEAEAEAGGGIGVAGDDSGVGVGDFDEILPPFSGGENGGEQALEIIPGDRVLENLELVPIRHFPKHGQVGGRLAVSGLRLGHRRVREQAQQQRQARRQAEREDQGNGASEESGHVVNWIVGGRVNVDSQRRRPTQPE